MCNNSSNRANGTEEEVSMTPGRGWWLAMLTGWCLLCLVHCSDSGLDDTVLECRQSLSQQLRR